MGGQLCTSSRPEDTSAYGTAYQRNDSKQLNGSTTAESNGSTHQSRISVKSTSSRSIEHGKPSVAAEVSSLFNKEQLISGHDLYNILNDGTMKPYIHDPFNLLLVDARGEQDYNKSRVITATHHSGTPRNNLLNYGMIVVYGGGISSADADVEWLSRLREEISEYASTTDVLVLRDGFVNFSKQYPFLITEKDLSSPWSRRLLTTYPSVVLDGKLYQGRGDQATNELIIDNLRISHVVNISLEHRNAFPQKVKYLLLALEDVPGTDLIAHFEKVTDFIAEAVDSDGRVLVHCNLGISRSSTCTIAYLMKNRHMTLKEAHDWLKSRRSCTAPNHGFLRQLLEWERLVHGQQTTNIDQL